METNISNWPASQPNGGLATNLRSMQAEQTALAAISTTKSMDVNIVTAEGDKVTISLEAKAASLYGSFQKADMDADGFSYQKSTLSASLYHREMTFTVEGDLNAAERRDIRKALKSLDHMMNKYVNGHLKPALATARKLQQLDTIAGLEANMSYERQILVARQTKVTAVSEPAAAPAARTVPASASEDSPVLQMTETADAVGDAMAKEVKSLQTPADRMMAFFDQLLEDYRRQMAEFNSLGADMIDRVAGSLRDALARFNRAVENEHDIAA